MKTFKKTLNITTKIAFSAVASTYFLMLISTAPAKAATFTFNTSDSQITPGINNQGWWSNIGFNNNDDAGYGVGEWLSRQGW
jgi:hypothetical protein